jgi:uncharacterized protein (TIGR02118 family)
MITIAFLLRRRADIDDAEFHRYWRDDHGPLVASHAEALGIQRYVQLHSLDPALSEALRASRNCEATHYDGVALVSFDSLEALGATVVTDAGRAASAALLDDEQRFIDLDRSVIWLTDTHVVIS